MGSTRKLQQERTEIILFDQPLGKTVLLPREAERFPKEFDLCE